MRKSNRRRGLAYSVSREMLEKFAATSTAWKLNWLEEINALTRATLTPRQRMIRDRLRRGELP